MSPEAFVDGRDQSQWIDPLGKRAAQLQSIKYVVDSAVAGLVSRAEPRTMMRSPSHISDFSHFCTLLKLQ